MRSPSNFIYKTAIEKKYNLKILYDILQTLLELPHEIVLLTENNLITGHVEYNFMFSVTEWKMGVEVLSSFHVGPFIIDSRTINVLLL